jgi:DNA-binding transcriptional ArsR family regulator
MEMQLKMPSERVFEFKARVFKVLGDSNRLRIIEFLRDGEKCQCEIIPVLEQSQPTVSRHLRLLEEAGLIQSKRDGNRMLYKVVDEGVFKVVDILNDEFLGLLSHGLLNKLVPPRELESLS